MIVIIDYGMGNSGSILNMIKKAGGSAIISCAGDDIHSADKLILPGVGSFDNAVKNLTELGLIPLLNHKVIEEKVPILGICLGMQLLTDRSEEGVLPGLGYICGETIKFRACSSAVKMKIPHMGWNIVEPFDKEGIFLDMYDDARFYFVHSYHVVCRHPEDILALTDYCGCSFASAVRKDNIYGTQFHPEKSHKFGLKLIKNFVELG